MFWINWPEIERNNDWGIRGKDDGTAAQWDDMADRWEIRSIKEMEFDKRQADAIPVTREDEVLDVGCGTGALTIPLAYRAGKVYAMDFNQNMLDFVSKKADEQGLKNVELIQGNWNTMEPGQDYPVKDIAITRHSPALGDVLKFSKCARKQCYFLNMVDTVDGIHAHMRNDGYWVEVPEGGKMRETEGRLYGINVHFSLLYEAGAHPTLNYVADAKTVEGESMEALGEALFPNRLDEFLLNYVKRNAEACENGYRIVHRQTMAILGWDPREIRYDLLEKEGYL